MLKNNNKKNKTRLELENSCTREQNHALFFLTWGFVVVFFLVTSQEADFYNHVLLLYMPEGVNKKCGVWKC